MRVGGNEPAVFTEHRVIGRWTGCCSALTLAAFLLASGCAQDVRTSPLDLRPYQQGAGQQTCLAPPCRTLPKLVSGASPKLPRQAARDGQPGFVEVRYYVDTRGRVVEPQVTRSTDPAFTRVVLEALDTFRFEPATEDGVPVRSEPIIHPFSFGPGGQSQPSRR